MFKTTCVLAAIVAAAPATARAQSGGERAFVNVGVGAQPQRHSLTASESFPLYDETATIAAVQHISNGAVIEFGGGLHVTRSLAIGAAFSMFGRPGGGTLAASVPDPIFYSRPAAVAGDAGDLEHKERAIHLQAIWLRPVSPKLEVSVSAGPSFIRVSQELATGSVPEGTQRVAVGRAVETGTAFGFNAAVQGNYMFTARYGGGLFFGYAGGSLDLPDARDVAVGGLRTGLALQARF